MSEALEILKKHSNICIDDYEGVLASMKEAMKVAFESGEIRGGQIHSAIANVIPINKITAPDKQTFLSEFFGEEK